MQGIEPKTEAAFALTTLGKQAIPDELDTSADAEQFDIASEDTEDEISDAEMALVARKQKSTIIPPRPPETGPQKPKHDPPVRRIKKGLEDHWFAQFRNVEIFSVGIDSVLKHPRIRDIVGEDEDPHRLRINYAPHERAFNEAFLDTYKIDAGTRVSYIECRGLRDADRSLRRHIGTHPELIAKCVGNENFKLVIDDVMTTLSACDPKDRIAIVFVCRRGTHRSEACRNLVTSALDEMGCNVLSSEPLSRRKCYVTDDCSFCEPDKWSEWHQNTYDVCYKKVIDLLRNWSASSTSQEALAHRQQRSENATPVSIEVKDEIVQEVSSASRESRAPLVAEGRRQGKSVPDESGRRQSQKESRASLETDEIADFLDTALDNEDVARAILQRLRLCFLTDDKRILAAMADNQSNQSPKEALLELTKQYGVGNATLWAMVDTILPDLQEQTSRTTQAEPSSSSSTRQAQTANDEPSSRVAAPVVLKAASSVDLLSRDEAREVNNPPRKKAKRSDEPIYADINVDGKPCRCFWASTGVERVDYAPTEQRDEVLDQLLMSRGREKGFQTYILGEPDGPKDTKIRLDVKFKPHHTRIGIPTEMGDFRKTTLVKSREGKWSVLEDRVTSRTVTSCNKETDAACLVFLQPPRYWRTDSDDKITDVAFNAVAPFTAQQLLQDGSAKVTTMTRKQRQIIRSGIENLQKQDDMLTQCLKPSSQYTAEGKLLAIVNPVLVPVITGWGSGLVVHEVDVMLQDSFTDKDILDIRNLYNKTKPSLVFSCLGEHNQLSYDDMAKYVWLLEECASHGAMILHIDTQMNLRWNGKWTLPVVHGKGNLSFASNSPEALELVEAWSWNGDKHYAPMCMDHLQEDDFTSVLMRVHAEADLDMATKDTFPLAFVAEGREEQESATLDNPDGDGDVVLPEGIQEVLLNEEEVLEKMPLPGVPSHEKSRRQAWLKVPRRARVAIRKMHSEWGHLPSSVLINILKQAKAPQEYVDAAMQHLCSACDVAQPPKQTSKTGPPRMNYTFNHSIGIDVFDLHDYDGNCHLFLNIVCYGTDFQIVAYLCPGPGTPSSRLCGEIFMQSWVSWGGWPREVVSDRGLHNRGYFSRMLGAHGICPRNIGLESPEQLGKVERRGGTWKKVAKRVIHAQKLVGSDAMRTLAFCTNGTVNDGSRKGGFSPSQWVLGKYPRSIGDTFDNEEWADLGCINEKIDAESAFHKLTVMRLACKRAFAEVDCSTRIASLTLRKAAPLPGKYSVGDLICFRREAGAATPEQRWSTVTRIIGFDGPKVVWGLNETLPVCLAVDKIRPASQAEALAFLYTHGHKTPQVEPELVSDEQQQAYIDEYRTPDMPGHGSPAAVRAAAAAKAAARNTGHQLQDQLRQQHHATPSIPTVIPDLVPGERAEEADADDHEPSTTTTQSVTRNLMSDDDIDIRSADEVVPPDNKRDHGHTPIDTGEELDVAEAKAKRRKDALDDTPVQIRARQVVQQVEQLPATRKLMSTLAEARVRSRTPSSRANNSTFTAFVAERTEVSADVKGNRRKQLTGKTLNYNKCPPTMQKGIDGSRASEWRKWMDFGAGVKIQGAVLDELLS